MNDEPTHVYIVTAGSYSDYHIERVYLTETEAEEFAATLEDGDVKRWPIAEHAQYRGPIWYGFWNGKGMRNGFDEWGYGSVYLAYSNYVGDDPGRAKVIEVDTDTCIVRIEGTSAEHVEKSLRDAIIRVKAERAGIS